MLPPLALVGVVWPVSSWGYYALISAMALDSGYDEAPLLFADLHRRYTGTINARARTTGHLWRARYGSVVMDETHLFHAIRYVTLNPLRAGLVKRAEEWPWSSARAGACG